VFFEESYADVERRRNRRFAWVKCGFIIRDQSRWAKKLVESPSCLTVILSSEFNNQALNRCASNIFLFVFLAPNLLTENKVEGDVHEFIPLVFVVWAWFDGVIFCRIWFFWWAFAARFYICLSFFVCWRCLILFSVLYLVGSVQGGVKAEQFQRSFLSRQAAFSFMCWLVVRLVGFLIVYLWHCENRPTPLKTSVLYKR